jgi:hypothetical protein
MRFIFRIFHLFILKMKFWLLNYLIKRKKKRMRKRIVPHEHTSCNARFMWSWWAWLRVYMVSYHNNLNNCIWNLSERTIMLIDVGSFIININCENWKKKNMRIQGLTCSNLINSNSVYHILCSHILYVMASIHKSTFF